MKLNLYQQYKESKLIDQKVKSLSKVFIAYLAVLILVTFIYGKIPILFNYSLLGEESFYSGFITNMYNSALDFFVFSIILFIVLGKHEKNDKVRRYTDAIADYRFLFSEEAAFKNAGNIRRLQELAIKKFDLSKSTLEKTKLKVITFKNSKFMGAWLNKANLDGSTFEYCNFQGAIANDVSLNNTKMQNCNFKYLEANNGQVASSEIHDCDFIKARLKNSIFRATIFKRCNFDGADLTNCSFERADLRDSINLTALQLMKCSNIKYAKVNPELENEIYEIDPEAINSIRRRNI